MSNSTNECGGKLKKIKIKKKVRQGTVGLFCIARKHLLCPFGFWVWIIYVKKAEAWKTFWKSHLSKCIWDWILFGPELFFFQTELSNLNLLSSIDLFFFFGVNAWSYEQFFSHKGLVKFKKSVVIYNWIWLRGFVCKSRVQRKFLPLLVLSHLILKKCL